jgi:hypothetical protein
MAKDSIAVNRNTPDPGVHVPEAVRRAAAAADAAMQSAQPEPPKPQVQNPPDDQFISIVQADPPQRLPQSVTQPAAQPQPQAEPQPPAPAQPQAPPAENWEHRYRAMEGRYKQAAEALLSANSRMEALETMLANMQSAPAAPPPPVQVTQRKLITQKDIDEVGPDLIDVIRRAAQEVVPDVSPLQQELERLRGQVTGTVQHVSQNARQMMHQQLDDGLPEWRTINHDPEFHAWLALPDPYSGATRKKLLTDAYENNQGNRVLSIFRGFASELAATRPTEDPPFVPQPQPQPAAPTGPTLKDLAAPGRARVAAAPQAPAEKQTIRTSDINAFYAAVRRGEYRGREELKAQYEAELNLAMREGRVMRDT